MHSPQPFASPRQALAAFAGAAVPFLALDALWLTLMGPRLYRPAIGHLMRQDFDVVAAAAFYAIYFTGILAFVVQPARHAAQALRRGALFGVVCYGTYDLTNQATVLQWPWRITFADLCWGAFATALAAWCSYRFAKGRGGADRAAAR